MSGSDDRPVSIELPLWAWKAIVSNTAPAALHDDALTLLEEALPEEAPTGLGAVVEARLPGERITAHLVLAGLSFGQYADTPWLCPSEATWYPAHALHITKVIHPGVKL